MEPNGDDRAGSDVWERAVVHNHREWFRRTAEAIGAPTGIVGGVPWAIDGLEGRELTVFLHGRDRVEPVVDELLEVAAGHDARSVLVWAAAEDDARRYGPTLLGRGFSIGWRPRWMWLTPDGLVEPPPADDEKISTADAVEIVPEIDQPFPVDLTYGRDLPADAARRLSSERDRRGGFVYAVDGGAVVGQSAVHLTDEPVPVGVIFNTSVVPMRRRQGIGARLTIAAARLGFELGVERIALNATEMGAPLYATIGFADGGRGHTWSRPAGRPVPTAAERALTEAVARDDAEAIDAFDAGSHGDAEDHGDGGVSFDEALPCGLTPFRLAGELDAAAAAEALHRRGARIDAVAAWRLGWHDRLPGILARRPEVRDARTGAMGATPLHEAVQRHDVGLARLLLDAGADVTIRDRQYRLEPLGWATYFGHADLEAMIGQASGPGSNA